MLRSRFKWTLIVLLFAGCRVRPPLPALPEVATASFLPSIRQQIDAALSNAKKRPDDAKAVGHFGNVLHAHDQLAAARACYLRASLLEPKNFDWLSYLGAVSDGPPGIEALRAALKLRDDLPVKLKLGEALLASGDSTGAAAVYRGLQHPAALFGYGRATNDPVYYQKALAVFPQYGAAMFSLAQYYRRTGRNAEAERLMSDYQKFRLTAPPVDDPLMEAVRELNQGPDRLLGDATNLEREGNLAGAVDLHLQALQLDPRLTQAHVNLISLYGRLGDTANAESHFRQAVELDGNAHEAYYNFGVVCYQSHRRAEAEAAFRKALAINPGHADAENNMGVLFEEEGKLEEAKVHFEKAIGLQPNLRLARFHLGRILANQRRFPQAIAQLEQAVAADDEATPTYLYALGATQARAGDAARASSTLAAARDKARARGQAPLAAAIERDLGRLRR